MHPSVLHVINLFFFQINPSIPPFLINFLMNYYNNNKIIINHMYSFRKNKFFFSQIINKQIACL